jgi:hypothetical protein
MCGSERNGDETEREAKEETKRKKKKKETEESGEPLRKR